MNTVILPTLPSELIERLSHELSGKDLFHFSLVNECYLAIGNYYLTKLLRGQSAVSLDNEINLLFSMRKSSYVMVDGGIGLALSSQKWNHFVYGCFKLDVIEKSLKYFSTNIFFLYCRLWLFTPFYYEAPYPTVNIFEYPYLLQSRSLSLDECELFTAFGKLQTPPSIVKNFTEFVQHFSYRYQYDVWREYIDWNLFVIAGGSVVSSLLIQPPKATGSDVDLFFLKHDGRVFERAVNELEVRLRNRYFVSRRTLWLNRLIQFDLFRKFTMNDICEGKRYSPSLVIQLIRPTVRSMEISRILHSFDLDVCGAAFDSKGVIISFACLQALNSGYTTCYALPSPESNCMKRVLRLCKYQERGFNILFPKEFNIEVFLIISIEECNEAFGNCKEDVFVEDLYWMSRL